MWGTGVDDENTIPARFNALHPDYRVHNHGESGFLSRQELARLINLVNQGEPMDLVVFYDGCNDVRTLCREDISINGHRSEVKITEKMRRKSATVEDLLGSVLRVADSIVGGHRPDSRCEQDPDYARRVAATMLNNWRIAKRVAELGGAEFHAILQPVADIGSPNIEYLPGSKSRSKNSTKAMVYRHVRNMTRDEQPDWIHDLTDVFDVDEYIYIDGCHVNGRGNELVARRLDQLIGASLTPKAR
jgi:lysophospholipase L1-like esterase